MPPLCLRWVNKPWSHELAKAKIYGFYFLALHTTALISAESQQMYLDYTLLIIATVVYEGIYWHRGEGPDRGPLCGLAWSYGCG